jgi:Fe-S oxidoreductase
MRDRFENILKNCVARCKLCGKCLELCPQIDLSPSQAKEEKLNLLEGKPSRVLSECSSCFACMSFCPNDADPHGLILYRWHEKRANGPPFYLQPVLPGAKSPNPISEVARAYSPKEKEFYDTFLEHAGGQEVLYLGCNQLFDPLLAISPLLKDLKAVASPDLCCGEPVYRLGLLDQFEDAARKWVEHWRAVAPSKMVFFCPACYNVVTNIYPKRLGIEIDFPTLTVFDWIEEKIKIIDPPKPLGMSVMLHDSCHAKMLGNSFYAQVRRIFSWAGIEVIEMKNSKTRSLCCGFASIAPRLNPVDVITQGRGRVAEARRSGADALAVYCNGCGVLFSVINRYSPRRIKVYHLLELLELACGRQPAHMSHQNAGRLAAATARTLMKAPLGIGKPGSSPED